MKSLFLLLTLVGCTFAQWDPLFDDGHYGIVHLFEWHWDQIADECEQFLGPRKFGGVQISPPTENRVVEVDGIGRPWWERYQPVAYDFGTRSGDRNALEDMVSRCNAVGVRIYADLVVNHMCGEGGDGYGTGGTYFNANDGSLSFPGVPYGENDFHPDCDINDYSDAANVKDCRLVGLLDIDQSTSYVRGEIVDLMNDMLSLGIAGFRVDAAKHMWVSDLQAIFEATNNVNVPGKSGQRPFIYQEVIDNGGSDEAVTAEQYVGIGTVTEFKYVDDVAYNVQPSKFTYLQSLGTSWGLISSSDALVFINNHDDQRTGSSGDPVTFWEPLDLKILTAFMMAYDYGIPRIMSSYYYTDTDQGPPDTPPPEYSTTAREYDCGGTNEFEWVCEHRWFPMRNLAEFGAVSQESPITNKYSPTADSMCLMRGDRSLMCLNNHETDSLNVNPSTSLSDGCYCNLYNTDKEDCYDQVTVSGGTISATITPKNGVMIHANAMCSDADEGYDSCSDCSCDLDTRVDCGYLGVNQQECESDGCNWCPVSSSSENIPYCFYK